MPEAVRLYPKAWVPIANDPTAGGRKSRSERGGAESAWSLVLWARLWSSVRATCSGLGRRLIDCGVLRATTLPTLFDQSACPVSRETAEGAPGSTETAIRVMTCLDDVVAQSLGGTADVFH